MRRPPLMTILFFFFFFLAEDGIRYVYVTGVQTCALPIPARRTPRRRPAPPASRKSIPSLLSKRSEERRVGKECRWRRRPPHQQQHPRRRPAPPARRKAIPSLLSKRSEERRVGRE